jgi:hypothetical protein
VPKKLCNAFHIESVQDISLSGLAEELKHKEKLAEETRDGTKYVALRDYRCVDFDNGASGMMIVIERYRIKDN